MNEDGTGKKPFRAAGEMGESRRTNRTAHALLFVVGLSSIGTERCWLQCKEKMEVAGLCFSSNAEG